MRNILIVGAVIVLVVAGFFTFRVVKQARIAGRTVVARVNGEPIYAEDLNRGLPGDSFDAIQNSLRDTKLQKMLVEHAIRQFLVKNHVVVSDKAVEDEVKNLERNPPSKGCPCCTYASLDEYLNANGYDRDDLRLELRNKLGLKSYAQKTWEKKYPTQADRLKVIGGAKDSVKHDCVYAWQIFLNTFQQPGYDTNRQQVIDDAKDAAQKAWERLQGGESFADVAKSVSEDMTSKNKGGDLGVVERAAYGNEFAHAMMEIQPEKFSKPFETPWGFHIIKWRPLTDNDVIQYCEVHLLDNEVTSLRDSIAKSAKAEIVRTK
jgi:hypothetical protein